MRAPHNLEHSIRFCCGAILGLFIFVPISYALFFDNSVAMLLYTTLGATVFGLLSMRWLHDFLGDIQEVNTVLLRNLSAATPLKGSLHNKSNIPLLKNTTETAAKFSLEK